MGLNEKVVTLLNNKDVSKNLRLKDVLERYENAMLSGCYQERIYESLIRDLTPFNYLLPVNETIDAVKKIAAERPDALMLTRILQEMSESADSYIYTELVVEDVTRFILHPSSANMTQAINALMPYAANPYINEMLRVIRDTSDGSKIVAASISEQAMGIADQIKMIRQNVSVEPLYSPVLYIRENQSVFSIPNQGFYLKNGNSVCPLDKKNAAQLDESFVQLSRILAQPNVKIDENEIYLSGEDLWATIYEDRIVIADGNNEYIEDAESLRRLDETCMRYQTYDTNFFLTAALLNENFNNIASLAFAKKIVLNSNPNITATLYRLEENLFLSLENRDINSRTFYRNVNPIFCKNAINEHFQINVASLFEDLLPAQDKIIIQLNETKNEYEKSIESYEEAIADLKAAKEDATTTDLEKELDDAIADAEKKMKEVKDEYLQWQKETKQLTDGKKEDADADADDDNAEDDDNVTKEVSNEPLDAEEVDAHKDELSTPLTANAATEAPAEEAGAEAAVTDDEFSEYLAQEVADDDAAQIDNAEIASDAETQEIEDELRDEEFYDEEDLTDEPEVAPEDQEAFPLIDTDEEPEFGDGESNTEYTDDNIFDTEEETGDEVSDEIAAEDIPSDEDIILTNDDEEDYYGAEDENPEDYKTIDAESGEEYQDAAATDIFGGDVENPIEDNATPDTDLYNPHTETSEFNIVNVMFDENVNSREIKKSGEVMVLRPMIDANGDKYTEPQTVKFYLNGDNEPVIQTDTAMSAAMYNGIKDAITTCPKFQEVAEHGVAIDGAAVAPVELDATTDADAADTWEEDYLKNGNDEDRALAGGESIEDIITDETPEEEEVVVADETPVVTPESNFDDLFADTDFDLDSEEQSMPATDTDVVATETPATEVPSSDPVDTYTDVDGTEIEVPAPDAEKDEEDEEESDVIPESKKTSVSGKSVNENRKAILGIKKKTNGKHPF